MNIIEKFITNNDCYKSNVAKVDGRYTDFQNNGPKGIMLHSVGCPQPSANIFVNNYNKSGIEVAVHAFVQADGACYQTLPWNYRAWHAGGSANNSHIGIEMTEPNCIKYIAGSSFVCSNLAKAREQVKGTYNTAVELFAYLCNEFKLDPLKDGVIISHAEGYQRGVASGHSDPEHLWRQLGMNYTMDGFRKDVKAAMGASTQKPLYRVRKTWNDASSQIGAYSVLDNAKKSCDKAGSAYKVFDNSGKVVYPTIFSSYRVKVMTDALNIRDGAGTEYKINGCIRDCGVYTIIEEKNGFGKLKSGAGWICLSYVVKV